MADAAIVQGNPDGASVRGFVYNGRSNQIWLLDGFQRADRPSIHRVFVRADLLQLQRQPGNHNGGSAVRAMHLLKISIQNWVPIPDVAGHSAPGCDRAAHNRPRVKARIRGFFGVPSRHGRIIPMLGEAESGPSPARRKRGRARSTKYAVLGSGQSGGTTRRANVRGT